MYQRYNLGPIDDMALTSGSQLGPYEIQSALGAGGTDEVYRARDTRLDRTVAIKILPHLNAHPELRERFEAEAKLIAGLQHPHIRLLHDIGRERARAAEGPAPPSGSAVDAIEGELETPTPVATIAEEDAIDFLVLEHLEGETVADRLAKASAASKKKAAFRLDEALAIAMQLADALDKAHQKGLVHRGLKPDSVLLVRGTRSSDPPMAKLLDFGLASSKEPDLAPATKKGASSSQSMLVTRDQATAQSAVIGEVEYLAPEQVEGKTADARTDLFAFGVVLYEMLTGKKAFEGKSRAVLMAAIMTAEPDPLIAAQPLASPALDHVLKRCLAKDPDDRWQTAHDLLIQLRWITGKDAKTIGADVAKERRHRWLLRAALGAAVVMAAALAAPLALYLRGSAPQAPFQFRSPVVGLNNADISVSPDGRMLAFMARPNQAQPASLFVRPLGGLTSRRLAGTDDATQPFWSPDSRYIGFSAGGKLKKVEAVGGPPQEIADAPGFAGGTWNRAGTILFGTPKGLFSVSAEGGKAVPVTTVEKAETGHSWPLFLPDDEHYIYLAWSSESTNRALYVGALGTKGRTRLMAAETNVAYASSGFLVFHREATLFAQPFDADTRAFTGDAVQIAGGIAYDGATGRGRFDVSQADALVYFQGGDGGGPGPTGRGQTGANMQLGWISRSGQVLSGAGDAAQQGDFDVSPDGKLVAVTRQDGNTSDIWVIDWQRAGNATRLTLDPADDINPVWTADGNRVAFTTYRKGNADIYTKNANGVGDDVAVLDTPKNEIVEAWSRDGRYMAYLLGQDNFLDIYVLPQFGDKKPFPVVQGRYQKNEPQFSFDGKWLAYTSDESGTFEVYVVSFPAADQKTKISRDGGGQPRWRADGKELFFRALDNRVMVVDLSLGTKIEAGVPRQMLQGAFNAPMTRDATRHQLSLTPDGQQVLLRVPVQQIPAAGRTGGVPQAPTVFDPATGQAGGRGNALFNAAGTGGGGGRAFAGGVPGLTVIQNWTTIARARKP